MPFNIVDAAFWTDPVVVDDFTPEDKYFYLYLLTSPHANVSGCYAISFKQMADELGYSKDTVERLVERFVSVHKVVDYDKDNKEILIHKWGKYHWTTSDKYIVALNKKIAMIKTERFRKYLEEVSSRFAVGGNIDTVWIPYQYGMDTTYIYTYPFTLSFLDNKGNKEEGVIGGEEKEVEPPVITLLLNDGTEYPVYQEYVDKMAKLYPVVDVMQELRNMSAWCINNPKKRKTRSGITRFMNTWLSNEQDKGGCRNNGQRSLTFMDVGRGRNGI